MSLFRELWGLVLEAPPFYTLSLSLLHHKGFQHWKTLLFLEKRCKSLICGGQAALRATSSSNGFQLLRARQKRGACVQNCNSPPPLIAYRQTTPQKLFNPRVFMEHRHQRVYLKDTVKNITSSTANQRTKRLVGAGRPSTIFQGLP